MLIIKNFYQNLLNDYFVFVLSVILIVTLWRAIETIELLSMYYRGQYGGEKDKKFAKARTLNK